MSALCAGGCVRIGFHMAGCEGGASCRGCSPRPVGAGMQLCWPCRDHIPQDARGGALLWHELLDSMTLVGAGMGEVVSSTPDRGLKLDGRAVEARRTIAEALAFWSKILISGRALPRPADNVDALAAFIAHDHNATWLATQDFAGRVARELHEIAWGEPMNIARPTGTRSRPLGPCPEAGCEGLARAVLRRPESLRPSCVECTKGHRWESHEWPNAWSFNAPQTFVSMAEAEVVLRVSADSVRQLVASGRLARYGTSRKAEFRLTDLDELRDELWPVTTD